MKALIFLAVLLLSTAQSKADQYDDAYRFQAQQRQQMYGSYNHNYQQDLYRQQILQQQQEQTRIMQQQYQQQQMQYQMQMLNQNPYGRRW